MSDDFCAGNKAFESRLRKLNKLEVMLYAMSRGSRNKFTIVLYRLRILLSKDSLAVLKYLHV